MLLAILLGIGVVTAVAVALLTPPEKKGKARVLFCNVWLAVCLLSLRAVWTQGAPLAREIPGHLMLFGAPALLVIWLSRRKPSDARPG